MPTLEDIIYNNLFKIQESSFVHSSFYYPLTGGSQHIANRLAEGIDIAYNYKVRHIERLDNYWMIDGNLFDHVVFCGNIKELPSLLCNLQDDNLSLYNDFIEKLPFHGTTTAFVTIESMPYSWMYLPDSSIKCHRIIFTGNFSRNNNNTNQLTATIEFTEFVTKEEIIQELEHLPIKTTLIDYSFHPYTYPIQTEETRSTISDYKNILKKHNLWLTGRFADWEYYNMDAAIAASMSTCNELQQKIRS